MKEALSDAALALDMDEIPVGAIVARGGEIIARGRNMRREAASPLAHAEMIAIAEAGEFLGGWRLDGCTLYVTLEPCPMCAGAMVQSRVSRVVYGAPDPRAGAAGSLYDILRDPRTPHRCEVTGGVMAAESAEMLRRFFAKRRRDVRARETAR
jgi:tRNA(adenine34) deaminase